MKTKTILFSPLALAAVLIAIVTAQPVQAVTLTGVTMLTPVPVTPVTPIVAPTAHNIQAAPLRMGYAILNGANGTVLACQPQMPQVTGIPNPALCAYIYDVGLSASGYALTSQMDTNSAIIINQDSKQLFQCNFLPGVNGMLPTGFCGLIDSLAPTGTPPPVSGTIN